MTGLASLIGGSTVRWFDSDHYLLANMALVGEAIVLAMRTTAPQTSFSLFSPLSDCRQP